MARVHVTISHHQTGETEQEYQHQGEPDDFLDKYQKEHQFDDLHYSHLDGDTKAIGRKVKPDKSGTTEIHIISFIWEH